MSIIKQFSNNPLIVPYESLEIPGKERSSSSVMNEINKLLSKIISITSWFPFKK